jgi:hypothetical protein
MTNEIEKTLIDICLKIAKNNKGCLIVLMDKPIEYEPLFPQDVVKFNIIGSERRAEALALLDGACIVNPQGEMIGYGMNIKNVQTLTGYGTRHCLSSDTEILTIKGWKRYKDLNKGDIILNYNLKKDIIEEDKIKDIFIDKINEKVFHIKNRFLDFIVTNEHKGLVKIGKRIGKGDSRKIIYNNYKLIPYNQISEKIKTKHKLSSFKKNGKSIGKIKASILGWVLSDAYISKRDKSIEIVQSFTANKNKCKIIEDTLVSSGLTFSKNIYNQLSPYDGKLKRYCKFRIFSKDSKWIFDFINIDRTPKHSIFELKGEELQEIYNSMMLGDGHKRNKNWEGDIRTQNKKRLDFFKTLCILLNRNSNTYIDSKGYYKTNINRFNECNVFRNEIKEKKYNGIVFCPTTNNNNTVIARRKNKIFITGNSAAYTASLNGNKVFLTSEEDKKVRIWQNGKIVMQIDALEKGIEKKTHEAASMLESLGFGSLATISSTLLAPAVLVGAGIAVIPGIIIFGSAHYVAKQIINGMSKSN